jgi:hypothetical protein
MPRAGGPASKYGHRYEDRWTARCALRVLGKQATTIHLEGPNSDIGFEFSLESADGIEYHQVKRQLTREGRWTLAALDEANVLSAFKDRLSKTDAACVFASTHSAYTLDELADSARSCASFAEFERRLESRLELKGDFEDLCRRWGADGEWAWAALKRVRVATISERELADQVALQAELYLQGPSELVPAALIEVLRDRVDHRLDATALRIELERYGITPRHLEGRDVAVEIAGANESFARSRRATLIGGKLIERPEIDQLEEALKESEIVFLHGPAGSGKSDILFGFCERLARIDAPYLALRLDRQEPVKSAQELGQALGLSGSPAAVLAAARDHGVSGYLIIDQLDALSSASGRNPRFFEAIAETIDLALSCPGIRVVLASRTFDAENDSRLRRLAARGPDDRPREVEVGLFAPEIVEGVLAELGHTPVDFGDSAGELPRMPIHLALAAQIAAANDTGKKSSEPPDDLYSRFWKIKEEVIGSSLGPGNLWLEALEVLLDWMSANQALAAPAALLDRYSQEREAMVSNGVLVEDGSQLAFFHETFFDYAFARRLIGRNRSVKEFLAVDQFLFRRAQVRQILEYARVAAPAIYLDTLNYLIEDPSVRFHLKDLVVAWLRNVKSPSEDEWRLLEPLLEDPEHPLHGRAWGTVTSPAWFELIDSSGRLERWLDEDDRRERALLSLVGAAQTAPQRLAELLTPRVEDPSWRRPISELLARSDFESRELLDLQLALIKDGWSGEGHFWLGTHGLEETHPGWFCELLGAYLAERLRTAQAAQIANPFAREGEIIPPDLHIQEQIYAAAEGAPQAFAEYVWPVIVAILERAISEHQGEAGQLLRDDIWAYRHFGDAYDLEDHLLRAAERALAALALQEPEQFEKILAEQAGAEIETIVALVFSGLAGNPERFADAAIDYLLTDPRRLRVGYSDGYHWGSRKLLESVSPAASEEALRRLEPVLLDYYPPWERSAAGHRERGMAQFTLLGGIAEERRTDAMKKRLAEWQRKFGLDDGRPPFGIQGGVVGSPIAPTAAEKMSNENWLRAIDTYSNDDFANRRDFLSGGAHQLAGVLESEAERDPVRFADLALKLPDEANVAYFEAILRGVGKSEKDVPMESAGALVKRCHDLPGRPCGQWIAHPLRRYAECGVPADLLEIVGFYAIEGDPRSGIGETEDNDRRTRQMRGLNSVRGGAAYEISRFVAANEANVQPLRGAIESLLDDPEPGVREMALEIPLAELRHDDAQALEWFLRGISGAPDIVLDSTGAHEFLRYRASRHFEVLGAVIERMLNAVEPEVRSTGAAQAALAALENAEAAPLLQQCLTGEADLRLGAAKVLGANVATARYRGLCEDALADLFNDPDADVRSEASKAIRHLRSGGIGELEDLARSYLKSPAFRGDPEAIVFAIDGEELPPVELAFQVVEAVLDLLRTPSDVRTRDALIAGEINGLLMKIYSDARTAELKNQALDLFDAALESNAYGAYRELAKFDRG